MESEDAVLIEVSGDGGSSFTQLERIEGISGSASGNRNYDISGAIAANTQVRIRIAPDNNTDGCCYGGGGETFIVDNLEVEACRDVPQPTPQPVAEWRFDEPSWNGISGEVGDASGNNLTGTANGADTVSGSPANTSADGTSTCNYGEFNGSSDFIALGNPAAINFAGEITMTAWIRPDRSDGIRNILEHGFRFSPNQAVYLRTNNNFYQSGSWNGLDYVATVAIPNGDVGTGTWVHVAGVYDGSTWRFYRNGVQVASRIDPVGAITVDEDWAIGARGTGTQRFFDGGIDEVRIYNVDLTAAQVQDVMNDTRSCPVNGPDHYSISAANGVACAPIDVTVAAHDSGHSLVDAQGSTVTLTTSTGRGTWSGSGVTDATPGDGTATLTFAPGASSANIQLSYTDIDIGDGTPNSDTFTVTVSDGAVDNSAHRPASTVSLSGFQFGTGNFSAGIANQTAGVNDNSLRLRAVRTDTNGNCTALYPNQTRSIGLAATYRNPTAGAGVAPTIIGNTINSVANGPLPTTYTPVNLSFDANSIANLSDGSNGFNYNDVGQLQLHARDGSNPLLTAQGSSNDFVVRPHHFDITVSGNPGTTASGNGFIAAGAPFGATVTARTNTNAIARNYGNEASPESVAVTINSLVIPVGGNSGGLSPGTATGGNGSFTVTGLSWNNVGTITLLADVADGNYL
ncbi:MAG: LamG domain-containing protein, partial [Porticoccaceae bacterium]|nr:LamG domain-containing protein [Porticoccaceae bacterium]